MSITALLKKAGFKLEPSDDRLIVEPEQAEEKSAGGIYIPEAARDKPQKGVVVAAGPGRFNDAGNRLPMPYKKGDVVLFGKYSGTELEVDGVPVLIVKQSDIFARIHE